MLSNRKSFSCHNQAIIAGNDTCMQYLYTIIVYNIRGISSVISRIVFPFHYHCWRNLWPKTLTSLSQFHKRYPRYRAASRTHRRARASASEDPWEDLSSVIIASIAGKRGMHSSRFSRDKQRATNSRIGNYVHGKARVCARACVYALRSR